jgi:hypothetical protein
MAVNIVANLLSLVSEHRILSAASVTFTRLRQESMQLTPECDGPVKHPPRNTPTFKPKIGPYSCATRSAAAFDAPNSECIVRSIGNSPSRRQNPRPAVAQRVSNSFIGISLGASP